MAIEDEDRPDGWTIGLAHIVIFTHEYDSFGDPHWPFSPAAGGYLLMRVLREIEVMGDTWRIVKGAQSCAGDAALLHVDATLVPPEYAGLAGSFACALNFAALDASKRKVSDAVLVPDDSWDGPVIVKSNLNFGGQPERSHNRIARRRRRPLPHPGAPFAPAYTVLNHKGEVANAVWSDPTRVVERFVPERVTEGYAMRVCLFMGAYQLCMRHISRSPIIKAANTLRIEAVHAHPALSEKRRRLGFDYGKFDYVEHDGEAILLDANRTPGGAPRSIGAVDFARSLHGLISG